MLDRLLIKLKNKIFHIDSRSQYEIAIANGMQVGEDVAIMGECILDPGHCWLIQIGNRVTLAPRVHILAHDASTKRELGYTKIGKVTIGDDVFIGAGTIVLPDTVIGNRVIIGAGSVVTNSIPDNSVAVGRPAKIIMTYDEYMEKEKNRMNEDNMFDESYKIEVITDEKKEQMKNILYRGIGFVR